MAIASGPRSNQLFIGLSGDTKPSAGVEFSAQFYEYDTLKTYIYTGNNRTAPDQGQWVEYAGPASWPQYDFAVSSSLT